MVKCIFFDLDSNIINLNLPVGNVTDMFSTNDKNQHMLCIKVGKTVI